MTKTKAILSIIFMACALIGTAITVDHILWHHPHETTQVSGNVLISKTEDSVSYVTKVPTGGKYKDIYFAFTDDIYKLGKNQSCRIDSSSAETVSAWCEGDAYYKHITITREHTSKHPDRCIFAVDENGKGFNRRPLHGTIPMRGGEVKTTEWEGSKYNVTAVYEIPESDVDVACETIFNLFVERMKIIHDSQKISSSGN